MGKKHKTKNQKPKSMCKILVINGRMARKTVLDILSITNRAFRSQSDGFGFVAIGDNGIARGRYLVPDNYPGWRVGFPDWLTGPIEEEGEIPSQVHTLLIHGRKSTNTVQLSNVHPFLCKDHYLIHNGVVRFTGPGNAPKPSCDSHQYLVWHVNELAENRDPWTNGFSNFSGWGAFAIYAVQDGLLHIARDGARLSIAKRAKEGWVIATDKQDILDLCSHNIIGLGSGIVDFPSMNRAVFRYGQMIDGQAWRGFATYSPGRDDFIASGNGGNGGACGFGPPPQQGQLPVHYQDREKRAFPVTVKVPRDIEVHIDQNGHVTDKREAFPDFRADSDPMAD